MLTVSWRRWEVLSMIASTLVSILCSTTSSKVANWEPTTEPAFLISLFSVHHSKGCGARHNSRIKHQEHVLYTMLEKWPGWALDHQLVFSFTQLFFSHQSNTRLSWFHLSRDETFSGKSNLTFLVPVVIGGLHIVVNPLYLHTWRHLFVDFDNDTLTFSRIFLIWFIFSLSLSWFVFILWRGFT